jgi:deazaflavin-dependent oxidoreductase (nitroreductase family)
MTPRIGQVTRPDPVVRAVRAVIAPATRTRAFRWSAPRVMPPIEQAIAALTGRSVQLSGLLVPSLILTTTGAKTGLPRDSVLMYTADGYGRAIIAGTSFARDKHPAWTYNLLAHPEAVIEVRGRRYAVRASLIEANAREEAWRLIESQWPGYRAYERESGRVVRLFRLVLQRELRDLGEGEQGSEWPHADPITHAVRTVVSAITRTSAWRWAAPRVMPPLESAIAGATGNRVQVSSLFVPSLILTTTGAKSGLPRDSVLMYTPDGQGRAIIAGTNWANERHPAWTHNLLAHPESEITVRGRRYAVRATVIEGDARDRIWQRLEAQWPEFRAYERDSGRTVRLFRLTLVKPLSGGAG